MQQLSPLFVESTTVTCKMCIVFVNSLVKLNVEPNSNRQYSKVTRIFNASFAELRSWICSHSVCSFHYSVIPRMKYVADIINCGLTNANPDTDVRPLFLV
jgi:hypothetical protein